MHGSLHHVEIYVPSLEVAKGFWGWFLGLLGYTVFQEWDSGISYKLADTYLVFVQTEAQHLQPEYHRCRSGLNHLAFHAKSAEFIDEVKQYLEARGITILYPRRYPHAGGGDSYCLFFEDPMRMKVELCYSGESL